MGVKRARIVVAGLAGDSGKTIVSLSLLAALRRRGLQAAPFKKGPDYIDPAWLTEAAGLPCRNLDTFLAGDESVLRSFTIHSASADIAVVEGNRGLFDGKDAEGSHSTAGLARLLSAPLLLVVNVTKTTRTIAAIIKGCLEFEPNTPIAGVILNKVAGKRHQSVITESIEKYCGLPVVGAIPKLGSDADIIPGRHLGLVPPAEYMAAGTVTDKLCEIAETYLDIDRIISIANSASEMKEIIPDAIATEKSSVRIGYFADSVFTFYYPENLEALQAHGAELVPVSSLADSMLPDIDALYIGGGFPETHAEQLTSNRSLMASVKSAAQNNLPIYAECGGLIYLCRSLQWHDETFAMAGVFPVDLQMSEKPVGHGYTEMTIDTPNPIFADGLPLRGHEFHYSGLLGDTTGLTSCMSLTKGVGLGGKRDGLVFNNTMACYTHLHAAGTPQWARSLVALAKAYAQSKRASGGGGTGFRIACM
ncbi:MAG: cobyrinate a,c-diamide synthase [Candidatus Zixiibacteriota bacterium]